MVPAPFVELVQGADPVGFWIACSLSLLIALLLLRHGLNAFWRLRLIRDTPTARLRSAPQGYLELIGQARPSHYLVPAKLTGLPCCWYRWRIEKRISSGRSTRWQTVEHGAFERPFVLDDGTGEALVNPEGALVRCRVTERWLSSVKGGGRSTSSPLGPLLGLGNRYRMTEERIGEGDPVYLLGHLETPRRGAGERDALARELLRQWKRSPERMRRFDLDGNGEIDPLEWGRARALAADLAQQGERRVAAEPVRSRIGATNDPRRPFLISTQGEAALVGQSRWQMLGNTLAGAALSAGALIAVVTRLG